jgi:putative nucleotidyltransferase with HDIG domain
VDIREQTKKYFEDYSKSFLEDEKLTSSQLEKIELKHNHPYRVADISAQIAESLDMAERDVDLAYVIGLLHDIGRFEQIKQYDSYDNSTTLNHGALGMQLLQQEQFLKDCFDGKDCEIIYEAVNNHDEYGISDNIKDEKCLSFCKLIRDADKIDILHIFTHDSFKNYYAEKLCSYENERKVSNEVFASIKEKRQVCFNGDCSTIDNVFRGLGFIFDVNFHESFKILREGKFVEKMFYTINDVKGHEHLEHIYQDYLLGKLRGVI